MLWTLTKLNFNNYKCVSIHLFIFFWLTEASFFEEYQATSVKEAQIVINYWVLKSHIILSMKYHEFKSESMRDSDNRFECHDQQMP